MSSTAKQEETSATRITANFKDHVTVAIPVVEPPITTATTTSNNPPSRRQSLTTTTVGMSSMRASGKLSNAHDDELLHRAVADAGRWAFGTILVEVWLLNEERTELYRPEAGWWIDPIYLSSFDDDGDGVAGCGASSSQICRLTDSKREDYCPPTPVASGVGIPGLLWTEDKSPTTTVQQQHQTVVWRNVKALAADPDQPWNARLQLLAELGLGWAAAVPLIDPHVNVGNEKQGIVIYMARDGVDGRRLRSFHNERYLVSASILIAAALAVRGPRQEAMQERNMEVTNAIRRVRAKLAVMRRFKQDLQQVIQENEQKRQEQQHQQGIQPPDRLKDNDDSMADAVTSTLVHFGFLVRRKVVSTLRKSRGANVKPPPTFTWEQAGFTFFAVFMTTLVLTFLSKRLVDSFGKDFSLVLGPFGAMLTLLFALTQAPASQPRNCIGGQAISMTIALLFTYIDGLDAHPQLRASIVTALAVSVMVKLGLTHPPAGAMALLFSEGKYGLTNMAMVLLGNVIAITMATLINNYTDMRQYPTFWGFSELNDYVDSLGAKEDGEHDTKGKGGKKL